MARFRVTVANGLSWVTEEFESARQVENCFDGSHKTISFVGQLTSEEDGASNLVIVPIAQVCSFEELL